MTMLKTYKIQTPSGAITTMVANSPSQATDLIGIPGAVVTGWRPFAHCSEDCGDCNDSGKCATTEQAR